MRVFMVEPRPFSPELFLLVGAKRQRSVRNIRSFFARGLGVRARTLTGRKLIAL